MQVSDELQQSEVSNAEKENSVKMKRQTIDLLPDAENNLLKLQVNASHQVHTCTIPSDLMADKNKNRNNCTVQTELNRM